MGDDRRRTLGRRGEELAAAHLGAPGFDALARNVRTLHGGIDPMDPVGALEAVQQMVKRV